MSIRGMFVEVAIAASGVVVNELVEAALKKSGVTPKRADTIRLLASTTVSVTAAFLMKHLTDKDTDLEQAT